MATLLAATPMLTIGPVQDLVQNTVYAMPTRVVRGYSNTALGLEASLLYAGPFFPIPVTDQEFFCNAKFIRATVPGVSVSFSAY